MELVLDLGTQPLANRFLTAEQLKEPEPKFPLKLCVCTTCWLMQLSETVPPEELFHDYLYYTSCSQPMVYHAENAASRYMNEFSLRSQHEKGFEDWVCEIASNDGYMLQWFQNEGVPCFGIEPAHGPAEVSRSKGIETHEEFFTRELAAGMGRFDKRGASFLCESPFDHRKIKLLLANNVLAHCPNINDFLEGVKHCVGSMAGYGRCIMEFPYGVNLIERNEFDTIYHEHVFYFTLTSLVPMFLNHGMDIYAVEQISVHGGALRIFCAGHGVYPIEDSVRNLMDSELEKGVGTMEFYKGYSESIQRLLGDIRGFIVRGDWDSETFAAYGASAKSTVMLNAIGFVGPAIQFICDSTPAKQGRFSPGLHIPIVSPSELQKRQPDYCVLMIWNFLDQVLKQEEGYRKNGGKFIVPVPKLMVV